MTRHIAFEGIDNFRDFGGYGTACGRGVRTGRLYRSANHARATDADLQQLADLGLAVIVDLRRRNEREKDVSRRWPGFRAQVIENDLGLEGVDEWHTFLASWDHSEGAVRDYLGAYYREAPFAPRHVDLYARYFRTLAEAEGPVLVHCTAGKDRTGILCALTHHLAGVHDDEIIQDYLLTNDPQRLEARLPWVRQAFRDATGRDPSDTSAMAAMSVRPEYLQAAFAAMREACGSVDAYLAQVLGIDARLRAQIHDRLLG